MSGNADGGGLRARTGFGCSARAIEVPAVASLWNRDIGNGQGHIRDEPGEFFSHRELKEHKETTEWNLGTSGISLTMSKSHEEASVTREVDETALDIGVDQFHADSIPHIQPLKAALHPAFRRRLEDADPRSLR